MGQAGLIKLLVPASMMAGLLLSADPASARHRMSFTPGGHGHVVASHRGFSRSARHRLGRSPHFAGGRGLGRAPADDEPAAAAQPGSGFKMEDGVLTYPAPARFQPKNLKPL